MNILLVNPPHHNKLFTFGGAEPLSLETLAGSAYLLNNKAQITIVDLRYEKEKYSIEFFLKNLKPDIVGITGYTVDVENVNRILERVKNFDRKIFTIVGGVHATLVPNDFNKPFVDAISIGMGEKTFQEVIAVVEKSKLSNDMFSLFKELATVQGLAIPSLTDKDGYLRFTTPRAIPDDLDSISAFPRRDLTKRYWKYYRYLTSPLALISTAKGCPHRCEFCSIPILMEGKYRTKSPQRVLEEILRIPQKAIRFADGNTFANSKRMYDLAELISSSKIKKQFIADLRSDTILRNEDLIHRWSKIGLEWVAIGLESIDDRELKNYNKENSSIQNIQAIKILQKYGINVFGQFIVNQNFEQKNFDDLVNFVHKNKIPIASYTILTPFPGTKFYQETKDKIINKDYKNYDTLHSVLPTKLPVDEFYEQFIALYRRTYSFKRYWRHLLARILTIVGLIREEEKRETRKDTSLILLIIIRLMLFFKVSKKRQR